MPTILIVYIALAVVGFAAIIGRRVWPESMPWWSPFAVLTAILLFVWGVHIEWLTGLSVDRDPRMLAHFRMDVFRTFGIVSTCVAALWLLAMFSTVWPRAPLGAKRWAAVAAALFFPFLTVGIRLGVWGGWRLDAVVYSLDGAFWLGVFASWVATLAVVHARGHARSIKAGLTASAVMFVLTFATVVVASHLWLEAYTDMRATAGRLQETLGLANVLARSQVVLPALVVAQISAIAVAFIAVWQEDHEGAELDLSVFE